MADQTHTQQFIRDCVDLFENMEDMLWEDRKTLIENLRRRGKQLLQEHRGKPVRKSIRVGQRLFFWDGSRGYVTQNTQGKTFFGPGESFKVDWLDADGNVEDSHYYTLEDFEREEIRFGRGVMPWAK